VCRTWQTFNTIPTQIQGPQARMIQCQDESQMSMFKIHEIPSQVISTTVRKRYNFKANINFVSMHVRLYVHQAYMD
jgi:hypothetical protein